MVTDGDTSATWLTITDYVIICIQCNYMFIYFHIKVMFGITIILILMEFNFWNSNSLNSTYKKYFSRKKSTIQIPIIDRCLIIIYRCIHQNDISISFKLLNSNIYSIITYNFHKYRDENSNLSVEWYVHSFEFISYYVRFDQSIIPIVRKLRKRYSWTICNL